MENIDFGYMKARKNEILFNTYKNGIMVVRSAYQMLDASH